MVVSTQVIKDVYGRILGKIDTLENGKQIAKDFYGRVLGQYDPQTNLTKRFAQLPEAKGNMLVAYVMEQAANFK